MENIAVYILTNGNRTVLYVGVTRYLRRRVAEHFEAAITEKGFTGKYKTHHLIYFEKFDHMPDAKLREKQIKSWRREKKEALIATQNPEWKFLEYDF